MQECIINHVTQTEKINCVSASLAMILDIDIEEITKEFDKKYHGNKTSIHRYLDSKEIKYRRCVVEEPELKPNHVYMISVPSLNTYLGTHSAVVQVTEDGCWWFFDPNEGRVGRKVYLIDNEIVSWYPCYEFTLDAIEEFRRSK